MFTKPYGIRWGLVTIGNNISSTNKENVRPDPIYKDPNGNRMRSYLDVYKDNTKHSLFDNDTRHTVFKHHPALLLKLNTVANKFKSRAIK